MVREGRRRKGSLGVEEESVEMRWWERDFAYVRGLGWLGTGEFLFILLLSWDMVVWRAGWESGVIDW